MKPKSITFDHVFERRWQKYLKGLTEYYAFSISYSDRIVFRILEDEAVYFIEIGDHDTCN
jgi:hypothetical protein